MTFACLVIEEKGIVKENQKKGGEGLHSNRIFFSNVFFSRFHEKSFYLYLVFAVWPFISIYIVVVKIPRFVCFFHYDFRLAGS